MSAIAIIPAAAGEASSQDRASGPGWSTWRKGYLWPWATSGRGGIAGGECCTREQAIEVAGRTAHGLGNDRDAAEAPVSRRAKRDPFLVPTSPR